MANAQRVLVIDDDESIGQEICDALSLRKFGAVYTDTLKRAEEVLREDKDIGIVFVDYHLVGITGPEIIRALTTEFPDRLAFVMITGDDTQGAVIDAMRAQAVDFLNKPVNGSAITAAIQRAAETRDKILKSDAVNVLTSRVSESFLDQLLRQNRIEKTLPQVVHDLATGNSRKYSGLIHHEPVDIVAMLRRLAPAIEQMGLDRQVEVRLRIPAKIPAIYTDASCVASCFRDVVVALLAEMGGGDKLTITTLMEAQFLVISFHIESSKFSSGKLFTLTDNISLISCSNNSDHTQLFGPRIIAELLHGEFRIERRSDAEVFLRLFLPRIGLSSL